MRQARRNDPSGARTEAVIARFLAVNPIACAGHGLCAELFPERVTLDEWGFPIVDPEPVTVELEQHARRAIAACPAMALLLRRGPDRGRIAR